jgi:hypothetical protein
MSFNNPFRVTIGAGIAAVLILVAPRCAEAQPVRWSGIEAYWSGTPQPTAFEGLFTSAFIIQDGGTLSFAPYDSLTRRRTLRVSASIHGLPTNREVSVDTRLRIEVNKDANTRVELVARAGNETKRTLFDWDENHSGTIEHKLHSSITSSSGYDLFVTVNVERRKPGATAEIRVEEVVGTLGLTVLSGECRDCEGTPSPFVAFVQGPNASLVNDNEFTDVVAVGSSGDWRCSGTLVRKNLVMTASHCGSPSAVWFGTRAGTTGVLAPVIRIRSFQSNPKIDAPLALGLSFTPVEARPRNLADTPRMNAASVGQIAGFGQSRWGLGRKVASPISIIKTQCKDSELVEYHCRPGEMVAGGANGDICWGDSGGPLYVLGKVPGSDRWLLAGITSRPARGKPICGEGSIYLRVDAYSGFPE